MIQNFSHNADMRNSIQMKAIRAKFGLAGYGLYLMLLEVLMICEGYKIEWDEVNIQALSYDFGIATKHLQEFVEYCVKVKLFSFKNGYLCDLSIGVEEVKAMEVKVMRSRNGKKGAIARWGNSCDIAKEEKVIIAENSTISKAEQEQIESEINTIAKEKKEAKNLVNTQEDTEQKNEEKNSKKMAYDSPEWQNYGKTLISNEKQEKEKKKEKEKSPLQPPYKEKEINKEKEHTLVKSEISRPLAVIEKVFELWNLTCVDLSPVRVITPARVQKVQARLKEIGSFDELKKLFEQMQASDFLKGEGKSGWKATFDWFFANGSNWVKVQEGNFNNKTKVYATNTEDKYAKRRGTDCRATCAEDYEGDF